MPTIHYREAGSGHPLIFLHGFCDTSELWTEFVRPFSAFYRVLTPDLPGFGKSEDLPLPFSIDQVADILADWVHELKLEKCIVVGHSLGGYVALALLERHQEMLAGLVLFHSTPYADSAERKKVRNKVIAFVQEKGVEPFIETFVPGLFADKKHASIPATRLRCSQTRRESLVGYAIAMRDRPDRSAMLLKASFPVLTIAGVLDTLIPLEDLQKLALKDQKIELFELPETGHMGMFEAKIQAQTKLSGYVQEVWPFKGT